MKQPLLPIEPYSGLRLPCFRFFAWLGVCIPCRSLAITAFVIFGVFGLPSVAAASCVGTNSFAEVKVGIRHAPPFVFEDEIRGLRGLSIELWESIAHNLKADGVIGEYEFVTCSLRDQLLALEAGDLDIVISPLTITVERLRKFGFTHQYLSSGLTVARLPSDSIHFETAVEIVRDAAGHRNVSSAVVWFVLGNVALALVIWLAWRNSDGEIKHSRRTSRGFLYFTEAIVRTVGLTGLSDKFSTVTGRILDISMIVVGTGLSTVTLGVVTSAMVGALGGMSDLLRHELDGLRIGTLSNSTSQEFVEDLPGREGSCVLNIEASPQSTCLTFPSWIGTAQALVDGKVDVVVGDWLQLSYIERSRELGLGIRVQDNTFFSEPYGWGITANRGDLGKAVDIYLLGHIRSEGWRKLVQEYIGDGSISSQ